MKFKNFLSAGLIMMFLMTGCTVYPDLSPIPEYEPPAKKFDTSAPVSIYPFPKQDWLNPLIRQAFAKNGYNGVAGELPVQQDSPEKAKVVVPLEFSQKIIPQEKGFYLDTHIIVMIRRPCIVRENHLTHLSGKRIFQAWSRILLKQSQANQEEYADGARSVLKNLFTIVPFRNALEPDEQSRQGSR